LGITVLRAPRGKYHWMVGHSPGFEKPWKHSGWIEIHAFEWKTVLALCSRW
jgi:hypothetical protein